MQYTYCVVYTGTPLSTWSLCLPRWQVPILLHTVKTKCNIQYIYIVQCILVLTLYTLHTTYMSLSSSKDTSSKDTSSKDSVYWYSHYIHSILRICLSLVVKTLVVKTLVVKTVYTGTHTIYTPYYVYTTAWRVLMTGHRGHYSTKSLRDAKVFSSKDTSSKDTSSKDTIAPSLSAMPRSRCLGFRA